MDNPFLPALICFGPFFLLLFLSAFRRRGQPVAKVPKHQVIVALALCFGVAVAGAAVSFLLI